MKFNDETMESCTNRGSEVGRYEIPLWQLTNVWIQEVKPVKRKTYPRRKETSAAHPANGGCYIVIDLFVCLKHRRELEIV